MAMQKRFKVGFGDVFPNGAFLKGPVEAVLDFNQEKRPDGSRPQQVDPETGLLVWQVVVLDADEEASKRETAVSVKIFAKVQPIPPENKTPFPWTPVEFVDTDARADGTPLRDHPYALLGKWARMLGFRGHFSTKSRRYSLTFGSIRGRRARFQRLVAEANRKGKTLDVRDLDDLLADEAEETTLVIGQWSFAGSGWDTDGDAELAKAAAARAREYAQWKAAQRVNS